MQDKKENKDFSSTFGKYTSLTDSKGKAQIKQPENITSDMWTPISAAKPEKTAKAENRAPAPKAKKSGEVPSREIRPISEGRSKKEGTAPVQKKKTKSRSPKGKPVAELTAQEKQRLVRKQNSQKIRTQQQLNKAQREYEEQLRDGKSPNEISKKRALIKRKKRIRRNIIIGVLFFAFVCAFAGFYIHSKGAPIVNITVEGESVYEQQLILETAGIDVGINMFSLNEKQISKKVAAELPYIHSVELTRRLPDSITVTVTPTVEKYLIVNGSEYICVDEHGKVLTLKKQKLAPGFFRAYGFEEQQAQVAQEYIPSEANEEKYTLFKRIVALLEAEGVMEYAVVDLSDMADVRILHNGKVMIYMGDCGNLEAQISLACNVIKSSVTDSQSGYIDMRYSNMAFFNEGSMEVD